MSAQPGKPEALSGIVVLEIADSPGACFAASLMADFNATVYACETLPAGSPIRAWQPKQWWQILARNKRSVALDPAQGNVAEAIRALLSRADVVVTDAVPAERARHPWLKELASLRGTKPLMLDLFPPGADRPDLWPWSKRADMAAAVSGQMALTGHADQEPLQPEFPMAEYLAGAMGALRAVAELRRRRIGAASEDVAMPLHVAMQRMIEWQVQIATGMGKAEHRVGNSFPMGFSISNMHLTRDRKYIAVSAANEATAAKLLCMLGGQALREDPRFATLEARMRNMSEIYRIMDEWMAARTVKQVVEDAAKADVVLGQIYDTDDILNDPHVKARGNVVRVSDGGQTVSMPAVTPRVIGWEASVRTLGPSLGAHTGEALEACGLSKDAIGRLRSEGAIR